MVVVAVVVCSFVLSLFCFVLYFLLVYRYGVVGGGGGGCYCCCFVVVVFILFFCLLLFILSDNIGNCVNHT